MRLVHLQKTVAGNVAAGGMATKTVYRVVKACTGEEPDAKRETTSWLGAVTCPDCQAQWVEHTLSS